jgi:hypothetical protein
MSNNKNIAIGSAVDVIIKVVSDRMINNKKYEAGEPYTILRNVGVNFNYGGVTKSVENQNGNLIDYLKQYPDSITIQNISLTQKIMDLLFLEGNGAQKTEQVVIKASTYFLPKKASNVYLYKNNDRITDFSYDEDDGKLTLNFYDSAAEYICFYNIGNYNYYTLETKNNAYFELDIQGKGNLEEQTSDFYICLPACALLTEQSFYFAA